MEKLLVGLFLAAIPLSGISEEKQVESFTMLSKVVCSQDYEGVYDVLSKKHGEVPIITTEDANSLITVWINPDNGRMTFTEQTETEICIIGIGERTQLFPVTKGIAL